MSEISCDEAEALLAFGALAGGEGGDEPALRAHLSGCASCSAAAAADARVAALLPLGVTPAAPPEGLRDRLMARVYREAADMKRASPDRLQRLWLRLPGSRLATVGAAALALVLAGVLAWRVATPTVVHVHGAAGSTVVDLYADPGERTASLEVRGLPATPAGGVYEVWLIPTGGAPQPAAYLAEQPDGGYATSVSGDVSGYATLAISLEPARGDPSPRGPIVVTLRLPG
ncbi:MAG TPA: anti-sigma factor [Candidatus Binatia bacterium]|nr:anti-sigma factor [Candidatus Binatia bacterium]